MSERRPASVALPTRGRPPDGDDGVARPRPLLAMDVRPLGSGQWSWGPDGKALRLHVAGLLCHHGWVDAHGDWWQVEHSLTERHAGVWPGVANNSARRDVKWNDTEAWPTWCARAEARERDGAV